jgi:ribosome recycling factor
MINDIKIESEERMQKSIDSLKLEMSRIRTGRAHPGLLEQVTVDYYGSETPLSQVANISVADSRLLTVTPWEKPMIAVVEKAIMNANLGLNPSTSGLTIRVPMPALTEERRKELIRLVRATAENSRISMRNIRRDANSQLKDFLKEKEISEDDERRGQELVQKVTDKYTKEVDSILAAKEVDLMQI